MAARLSLLLLCTLSCMIRVWGCGITTHTEISHRALDLWHHQPVYQQILGENEASLQAGSPYPDSFYNGLCYKGKLSQVSEDTHWAYFMRVAIEYMREQFPPPLNQTEEGSALFSFILGIASHQIADVVWHASLTGAPNGLIDADAWTDYYGVQQVAHSSVDLGGDVLVDYDLELPTPPKWTMPTKHLERMYERFASEYSSPIELNCTSTAIDVCSDMLWIGRFAEHGAFALMYPKYAANNSWFLESFYSYYFGGVDNMAAETMRYWDRIVAMYEKGVDVCDTNHNPYWQVCSGVDANSTPGKSSHIEYTTRPAVPVEKLESSWNPSLSGATVPNSVLTSSQPYANLGHASLLADVNGDGVVDLIVGAPNYYTYGCPQVGRVFVIYGKHGVPLIPADDISVVEKLASVTLDLPAFLSCDGDRFGNSLTAVDLNRDGILDLVVGAPSRGLNDHSYHGMVAIYAGSAAGLPSTPYAVISGDAATQHQTFGWSLSAADIDGDGHDDLIVSSPYRQPSFSSPQRGAVWIYLSSVFQPSLTLSASIAQYTLLGDVDKGRFGMSTLVLLPAETGFSAPLLIVGAPNSVASGLPLNVQASGQIFGFWLSGSQAKQVFVINGVDSIGQLGHSLAFSKNGIAGTAVLAVSAPSFSPRPDTQDDFVGEVHLLNLNKLVQLAAAVSVRDASIHISSIVGSMHWQRLGWSLSFTSTGSLLLTGQLGSAGGSAYVVPADKIPTAGSVEVARVAQRTYGGHWKDHFGSSAAANDDVLIVGAAKSNLVGRESGSVFLISLL